MVTEALIILCSKTMYQGPNYSVAMFTVAALSCCTPSSLKLLTWLVLCLYSICLLDKFYLLYFFQGIFSNYCVVVLDVS